MSKEMGRHTPGPWSVKDSDTVVGPAGNVVAECCGYSVKATTPEQQSQGGREANARLIAAAPELLTACKAANLLIEYLRARLRGDDMGRLDVEYHAAKIPAAILKAEGGAA